MMFSVSRETVSKHRRQTRKAKPKEEEEGYAKILPPNAPKGFVCHQPNRLHNLIQNSGLIIEGRSARGLVHRLHLELRVQRLLVAASQLFISEEP